MGWSKYIVDDQNEIKYEISRNIREEDFPEFEEQINTLEHNLGLLNHRYDEIHNEKLADRTKHHMMDMAYALYDIHTTVMDFWNIPDFMFMLWLKRRNIKFRVISEFDLDKDDEPADDYKTISRYNFNDKED